MLGCETIDDGKVLGIDIMTVVQLKPQLLKPRIWDFVFKQCKQRDFLFLLLEVRAGNFSLLDNFSDARINFSNVVSPGNTILSFQRFDRGGAIVT